MEGYSQVLEETTRCPVRHLPRIWLPSGENNRRLPGPKSERKYPAQERRGQTSSEPGGYPRSRYPRPGTGKGLTDICMKTSAWSTQETTERPVGGHIFYRAQYHVLIRLWLPVQGWQSKSMNFRQGHNRGRGKNTLTWRLWTITNKKASENRGHFLLKPKLNWHKTYWSKFFFSFL